LQLDPIPASRSILCYRAEGLLGLYRGFGLSVVTFVPSSALWWGAYGGYQKLIWQQLDGLWAEPAVITELTAGGGRSNGSGSSSSDGGGGDVSGAKRPTSQVRLVIAIPTFHWQARALCSRLLLAQRVHTLSSAASPLAEPIISSCGGAASTCSAHGRQIANPAAFLSLARKGIRGRE
jgi:Mitochondrial carrier protein